MRRKGVSKLLAISLILVLVFALLFSLIHTTGTPAQNQAEVADLAANCVAGQALNGLNETSLGALVRHCVAVSGGGDVASLTANCVAHKVMNGVNESSAGALTKNCVQLSYSDLSGTDTPTWANILAFPSACAAGSAVGTNGATNTCVSIPQTLRVTADTSLSTAQPTRVQSKGCFESNTTATVKCRFTSNPTAGNILIVCAGDSDGKAFNAPTDGTGNSFVVVVNAINTARAACYSAYNLVTQSDLVTVTTTSNSAVMGVTLYEIAGGMGLGISIGTGFSMTGTGTTTGTIATASLTFQNHPFFISMIAGTGSLATLSAGANFALQTTGHVDIQSEYSGSGLSTSTTFPATSTGTPTWAEVGLAVAADTSTTLTFALAANTNYVFHFYAYATVASFIVGIDFIPNGATLIVGTSSNTQNGAGFSIIGTGIAGDAYETSGIIMVGSTSGTFTIDFCGSTANNAPTLKTGSWLTWQTVA
ncbi:MAG: hypothetical protein KGH74_03625 [Candidatus Micrarchaeota archaeon]|nr:hypothetical protein [Candidatus Micrarchaeota archaeon]